MFVPNSFTDWLAGGTPITAATLNNLEQGVVQADITNPASAATTALAAALVARGPFYNVKDYGATGNGSTDDTAGIQAAMTAAGNAFGGTVWIPQGVYLVSARITIPAGVVARGTNRYASTIKTSSATAGIFLLGALSAVVDLGFTASVTQTAGVYVDIQANSGYVDNCGLSKYFVGVQIGTSGGSRIVSARVTNSGFDTPAITQNSCGIAVRAFAGCRIDGVTMVGTPSGNQPDAGVWIESGDTFLISNSNITRHGRALLVNPTTPLSTTAIYAVNTLFDSAGNSPLGSALSCVEFIGSGFVYHTKFSNCWFGLSAAGNGCKVQPSGGGAVDGLSFDACEFSTNGVAGLSVSGAGVQNWSVTGGWSAGNVNYGILAANATTLFTITGHRAGNVAISGVNGIALNIAAGASDGYAVIGNNFRGNTTSGIFDGGTGTNKLLANNLT